MTEREKHPPYWFHHEYLDEARRLRVHKFTADTESDARRMHRQACEFRWVTQHVEPSVSPLFRRGDGRDVAMMPGKKPGQVYGGEEKPIGMPDYLKKKLANFTIGGEI